MKNEDIQQLTASLPLTLDEEYEMQQTWRKDEDKCTFIILCRKLFENNHNEIGWLRPSFLRIYSLNRCTFV